RYQKQSPEEEDTDDEEDIDDEDDTDDEVASTPLLQISQSRQKQSRKREEKSDKNQPKRVKKHNIMKINIDDFSEETLRSIEVWYKDELDPQDIFGDNEVTKQFSKPIKKQLMSSDVDKDQCRLMLSKEQVKEKMLPFLEESEDPVKGVDVSVYGPDGAVQKMKFKIWNGDKTPVLTSGWKQFVADYGLVMTSDFIIVWMFRHIKTRNICFAIANNSFPLKKKSSR
ncbi:putative B3 domain-containing protein At4g03170, partial [Arabidopsis lyrata subsp. lyrata]|uniref:putative B3 domain-containing protein At4g03170 n=1 Tax=Arabidopsis lyrata subsp. lyrata TaxID=81972 RepID=UPI000A29E4E9